MSVLALALPVVAGILLYKHIMSPVCYSPLSSPASHRYAHIMPSGFCGCGGAGRESQTMCELHQEYGAAASLVPTTRSLNC
ncbi:hypothetical protein BDW66DRAFT_137019 [Aspergillus desertorum]